MNINIDYKKRQYLTVLKSGKTPKGNSALYIGNLEQKKFEVLNLLSCQSGNIDEKLNVAELFIRTQNINAVVAWDGKLSFTRFTYKPRLSHFGQGEFKKKYKRDPYGKVIYLRNYHGPAYRLYPGGTPVISTPDKD